MGGASGVGRHFQCALVLFLLAASIGPIAAQESRATLLGTVTDKTGGALASAHLTAVHDDTDVRYSAESNGDGNYVIPYLPPGAYRLRVEHPGFRAYERGPLLLRTGDRVRINVEMQVGWLQESVAVSTEVPLFGPDDSSSGSLIDGVRVAELPIAHGNAYHLTRLSAGVAFAGNGTLDRPFDPTHIANYAMAGAYALRNEITLDGSPNSSMTAGRNQTTAAYVPPADIIDEMRITTVALDASIGNTEGGAIGISLKSGSNTPHATAYYNVQSPNLFANSWLANKTGVPRADFTYNRWGASASGPVKIPGLYKASTKTFFLWGYEGIRERRPRTLGYQTVPTEAERQGNFSALLALGSTYQLYDPATRRRTESGSIISSPFAGNLIPAARINPIATRILQYYALPNAIGTADGQNNLTGTDLSEHISYWNQALRIDHNSSDRNRVFFSGAVYNRRSDYLNYFNNPATGEVFQFASRRAALDDVYVISPRTVLNLRYSYNRFVRSADLNPQSKGFDLTTLAPGNAAWAAWNDLTDAATRRFPLIDINGYFDLVGTSTTGVLFRPQDTHSAMAAVDRVAGPHILKMGGEYRVYRKAESSPYPASNVGTVGGSSTGWLQFGEDWTKGPSDTSPEPPIGAGLASFLLGLPTGGGIARTASFAEQSSVTALYIQDDWKVSRNLTLTLGLRYELEGPLTERYNRSVRGFDSSAVLPIENAVEAKYAAIAAQAGLGFDRLPLSGGLTFEGVGGQPRELYDRDPNNFMPRVGIAYSPDSATVLRAGYGIFFGALGIRRGDVYQTGFSQTTPLVPSRDNGLTFIATLNNPFPDGVVAPAGSALGPMTAAGDQISFFNTHYRAPYVQRWQFGLRRRLAEQVGIDVSYVGNRSVGLETTRNLNGIPLQYLSPQITRDQARIDFLGRQVLDSPFYGVLPATSPLGSQAKISRASLVTAYPQFTRVQTTTNEGYSWYHSLEIRMEKRFSGGLTASGAYTWSKFMEATDYLNDMDPRPCRTISGSDYPHRFSASWIYELPFGRERWLGGNSGSLNAIIGGWQLEGIYVYQSGSPLSFGNIGFIGDVKNIPLPADQRSPDRWFNTGAGFILSTAQAPEYNLRTFPLRLAGVRGPAMNNWDLSALKNTYLGDKLKLQLRAEFLNAMNHPWFANPNTLPTSSAFGRITVEQGYMRRVQIGIKLLY